PPRRLPPLPLHDALPIWPAVSAGRVGAESAAGEMPGGAGAGARAGAGVREGAASRCVVDGRDLAVALRGGGQSAVGREWPAVLRARKSTRLTSSHVSISY